MSVASDTSLESRARQTRGESAAAIYRAAIDALDRRGARGAIVDVGCGTGALREWLGSRASSYVGVDAVRYDRFPPDAAFIAADLNQQRIPVPDRSADVVLSLETIEHLENPRAFLRELVRVTKSTGWVVITTPNQRSLVSLGALVTKEHFSAFRDSNYPAHQTALLDTDLRRIAEDSGLREQAIEFTGVGRMPLTHRHYPRLLSKTFPRACSDNVLLIARKS